jgi:hypothetical protein
MLQDQPCIKIIYKMKQIVMLLTGFLLATTVLHAQEKQPRFLTELSVGPSFPIGKFASRSYGDMYKQKPPGLAKTGWGANFSVGYYLNKSVGLLLSAGYSDHKQDLSGYARSLYGPAVDPWPNLAFKAKNWKELNVRGGVFFVTPLTANHRLNLVTKLTAGICKTAVPGFDWKSFKDDGTLFVEDTEKKVDLPWGFCYQANVALKYKLGNQLHVLLDVNSFNAISRKSFGYETDYPNGITRQYSLNTINCMAGIGIDL